MVVIIEPRASKDRDIVTLVSVERSIPEAYYAYKDLFACNKRLPLPVYYTIEHRIDLTPRSELL